MKTQRVLIVVLSLLVVVLGYLALSNRRKPEEMSHANTAEMSHTNSGEMWYTNTVERWRTNTLAITNTVLQTVTNEVVKEVPAKLSTAERQAGIVGYKSMHAPMLETVTDALYKVGPLVIDVYLDPIAASLLGRDMDGLRKKVELALRARNIAVADKSPYTLRLSLSPLWRMSDPRVALLSCRLELKDTVSVERQGDIVQCARIVWSTTTSKFVRTINLAEEVDKCIQDPIDKFCNDYLKAREGEKDIQSRIPTVPPDFLSGGQRVR